MIDQMSRTRYSHTTELMTNDRTCFLSPSPFHLRICSGARRIAGARYKCYRSKVSNQEQVVKLSPSFKVREGRNVRARAHDLVPKQCLPMKKKNANQVCFGGDKSDYLLHVGPAGHHADRVEDQTANKTQTHGNYTHRKQDLVVPVVVFRRRDEVHFAGLEIVSIHC